MSKKTYERILLVTNGLRSSDPVHETAFNLAKADNASVRIVDTLQPPSTVNRWISSNAEDVFEMVLADKQKRLEAITQNFRNGGIEVDHKVLLGKSSETITREAIEWDASLVVRYKKGAKSKFPGIFGSTARSLMRYCPTPILLVGSSPIKKPRVLACIDAEHDDNENRSIIEETCLLSRDPSRTFGLYCWELYGEELMQDQMSEQNFKDSLEYGEQIHKKCYDEFLERHDVSGFKDGIRLEHGYPSSVIPGFCDHEKIDVVVMCSATLNHPLKRFLGSTVESAIEEFPCSLLVVKPIGFTSPLADKATKVTNA